MITTHSLSSHKKHFNFTWELNSITIINGAMEASYSKDVMK